jgi:thimet oligopeptidase
MSTETANGTSEQMTDDMAIARLASGNAADLAAAADDAVTTGRAGLTAVRAADRNTLDDITVLDMYDEAIAAMNNIAALSDLVTKAHPDRAMRDAADAAYQMLHAELAAAQLDPELYAVLTSLDVSGADAATRHFMSKTLREFQRAGVDRDQETRDRIKALQDEITGIGLAFERNIASDTRVGRFPESALDGLPGDYVRAHAPGDDDLVAITTEYPDYVPFQTYARDGAARERMWRIYRQRAYPDNLPVLRSLIERRHELATLLGYRSWAEYVTGDKMIGSDTAAADFIAKISAASGARAAADYDALLERKRVDEPDATEVFPWDTLYLQDQLKAEKLAFDTQAVRPYFEYERTKAGLMDLVARMFEVTFRRRDDVPVWHEEVEVYDVTRAGDGTEVGRIYLDMHPRTDKFNHAAMFDMRTGKDAGSWRRRPECALLCNLPKPGKEAALLQHSDVTTFFHEFGHLIHHLIGGHQRWSGVSGITTEWDFVEAPSQLLEEWTFDAGTLADFAIHHETHAPLPADMVAKLRAADEFGKGLFVRQQMYYAAMSLNLYRTDPATLDIEAVCRAAMAEHLPYAPVDDTYMYLSFGHLDGYSAVYYTYMWSLVIAKDLFTRFAAEGLPAPDASAAYRDSVLAPGGSAPAADLVRAFLDREYSFDAFQTWLDA